MTVAAPVPVPVASLRHPLARTLLVLTFTTGIVDAVSFLGLGRVFTANMTGNVVLLGFGIVGSGGLPVIGPVSSLVAFVLGTIVGGTLVRRVPEAERERLLLPRALAIEAGLIAAAAVVAGSTTPAPGDVAAYLVIMLLAVAMGIRTACVRKLGVPDLSTVVLTLTLVDLAANSPLAGGSGLGSVRRLTYLVVMGAGAVAGALLLRTDVVVPLAVAAALAVLTREAYRRAAL
jgi:uncharacterized membrane protein YoaK (UPF0700 family)